MEFFKKNLNYCVRILIFGLIIILSKSQAATYYVDGSVSSSGTGLSWTSPKKTISEAIIASSAGSVILVKYGTYTLTSTIYLNSNRMITSDDGNGTSWDNAEPDSSLCIITGGGSRRVIYMNGTSVTNATRIRGFKITGGNATNESTMQTAGGGMLLMYGASPIIENCWITGNVAATAMQGVQASGGGICSWYSGTNPIIRYNYFYNNIALTGDGTSAGGAIYATVESVPEIYGNIFKSNKAAVGAGNSMYPNYAGAVYVDDGSPKIYNNIFDSNIAIERTTSYSRAEWGPMAIAGALEAAGAIIVNNLFINNIALNCPNSSTYTGRGASASTGAVHSTGAAVIMNNTFVGNLSKNSSAYEASGSTAALYVYNPAAFKNNIFSDHPSYGGAAVTGGTMTIMNNTFYNNSVNYTSGTGTITSLNEVTSNPQYVSASTGDYKLLESSPCVNAGDPSTNLSDYPMDLANKNRVKGGTIDIGAYEFQSNDPPSITSPSSAVATEDIYFSYYITTEDDAGANVSLTVDNLPAWLSADADSVIGTALEGMIDTSFRVIASDGSLNDTLIVTVDVVLVNDSPVISNISDIEAYGGDIIPAIFFTVSDEETAADNLQISFLSSSSNLIPTDSISLAGSGMNREISLKPVAGKIGKSDITVQVSDGSKSVSEQFSLTILKPNSAPDIIGTPILSVNENSLYYFGFRISDCDGNPFTFSATFPDWLLLDSTDAAVSVFAGNGSSGYTGNEEPATDAAIGSVYDVAVDQNGNIYIAEKDNYRVCKITPDGIIHNFAGNGNYGNDGDGGLAVNAQFQSIFALAVDQSNNVYILDNYDHRIRVVTPDGIISHFAGTAGNGGFSGDGEAAATAKFYSPLDIFIDAENNMYVADTYNYRIRKIDTNGIITTVAGSGNNGFYGDGGPALSANLSQPTGVCLDASGNMYIADMTNNRVRKVDTDGIITTFAGDGSYSSSGDGGLATEASMYFPQGVVADRAGNVFVSVRQSNNIRKIDNNGIITTILGSGSVEFGDTYLLQPNGLCLDGQENLLIADVYNHRVRKLAFPSYYLGGTPTADNIGNHQVNITASDGFLSNTLEYALAVLNVNDPPRIVSETALTAIEDQPFFYIGMATDPDDSLFIWKFEDYPDWLTARNDSIFGIPVQSDTNCVFKMIVSDGEYSDTAAVSITITYIDDKPVIISSGAAQATEDEYFVYKCIAVDEEHVALNFTFTQLPRWLTADADSVFGTPLEGDRDTSFLVIASDQSGSDSLIVSIRVISVNDPPVFAVIPDTGFAEDGSLILMMNSLKDYIIDPDTPDSLLEINVCYISPLIVDIQNDTILVSAEPNWFGTDTIRLVVYDDILSDTTKFALTVFPVNDPPVFTELIPDSLVLEWGEKDTLDINGFVLDIDTPDSLLIWQARSGNFVDCQWVDSLKYFLVSVITDSVGTDSVYIEVSDGEFQIAKTVRVIVNSSVGINDYVAELPKTFALKQNYPNPFNPTTIIPYDLPEESHVDIRIYDLRGREIITLMRGNQPANHYQISWDGRDKNGVHVASGIYLYRMIATSQKQQYSRTRKLIIMQ